MKSLVIRRLYEAKTEQIYWKWLPDEVRNLTAVSDADEEGRAAQNLKQRHKWDANVRKYTAESVALARVHGTQVFAGDTSPPRARRRRPRHAQRYGLDEMVQPMKWFNLARRRCLSSIHETGSQ